MTSFSCAVCVEIHRGTQTHPSVNVVPTCEEETRLCTNTNNNNNKGEKEEMTLLLLLTVVATSTTEREAQEEQRWGIYERAAAGSCNACWPQVAVRLPFFIYLFLFIFNF
jgi:hypothetical protein